MTEIQQYAYWMAFAHLPRWKTKKINQLIMDILEERKMFLSDFFEMDRNDWLEEFDFNPKEVDDLETTKTKLPNYSFLVEDLLNQGFELIPLNSEEYSPTLKNNLKLKYAPPLLYVKGNKDLLKETSIAIVGSRKASDLSLNFTKIVAQNAVKNFEVVVSGFAKGVDRTALEETLQAHGKSIIVLPQGIMTFSSGFKKYYSQLVDGDILVVSTYHPKVPWSIGLAMGRNLYIYGLAEKIYVAESDSKGGTWSGAVDGLKKGREIYVRVSRENEGNSNNLLLRKGATPVDNNGMVEHHEELEGFEEKLKNILTSPLTAKEIKEKTHIEIEIQKLSKMISELPFVKTGKKDGVDIFSLKVTQTSLF
jgi:predicted Rossmann fold nucleotide-binding protein DprA/Smf involved in DNA uptake|tara:strand:+ start:2412 stop:3503 length:1092 start_codon:yes stop_codon:yes gene_type:complete